ncbi:mechanosensitive ion channel family protein [Loigolactobacillus iwatensis]|uniref:mechanosensitive ion channel family protein n=1 Tax=Loigolactobacillus iwatensis TaxID=1267156 RepID=UPI001CDB771E|nr:mechanosensitive ion channel family protein [Loigolactobacillus iwatensis]
MLATMQLTEAALNKSVNHQANLLTRFVESIQWIDILNKILGTVLEIILFSLLFWLINKIARLLIDRSFNTYKVNRNISEGRSQTIFILVNNTVKYVIFFFYLYAVLSVLGVPVGTLIASAGILSVALGLGAQNLVKDILSGFFILLEQQLDVGDHVIIGSIEGIVTALGLRVTQVKSFDGTLNYIPNSNINIVSNLSRNNMRIQLDVRLFPKTDPKKVTTILNEVNQELTPKYPDIESGPDIFGIVDLGNGNLALRVVLYTKNGAQGRIQSDYLAAYMRALAEAGIEVPTTPLTFNQTTK